MNPQTLVSSFRVILARYGIDNLALEMELAQAVKDMETKLLPERTPEQTKTEIAESVRSGAINYALKELIVDRIKSRLKMNPGGMYGGQFVEYAYSRAKHGETIDQFLTWWLKEFPDHRFWSWNKMEEQWPMAFDQATHEQSQPEKDIWADFMKPGKEEPHEQN